VELAGQDRRAETAQRHSTLLAAAAAVLEGEAAPKLVEQGYQTASLEKPLTTRTAVAADLMAMEPQALPSAVAVVVAGILPIPLVGRTAS